METDAVPNREPLPFTDEEYSARLAAVRRNMEAAGDAVNRLVGYGSALGPK